MLQTDVIWNSVLFISLAVKVIICKALFIGLQGKLREFDELFCLKVPCVITVEEDSEPWQGFY